MYDDCMGGKINDKGIFFKIFFVCDIYWVIYLGIFLGDEYRGLSLFKNFLFLIFC